MFLFASHNLCVPRERVCSFLELYLLSSTFFATLTQSLRLVGKMNKLSRFVGAVVLSACFLVACGDDDDSGANSGGSGGSAGSSGSSNNGGSSAAGNAGTAGSTCVDLINEPAVLAYSESPGSFVYTDLAVDGADLLFLGSDGISQVPISGGSASVLSDSGGIFRVVDTEVYFFNSYTKLYKIPRTGGTSSLVGEFEQGQVILGLGPNAAVATDKLLGDGLDNGNLLVMPYTGGTATQITNFQSKLQPFQLVITEDKVFFGTKPTDSFGPGALAMASLAGGETTLVALPAGLSYVGGLGYVNGFVYVSAADEFLKETIFKLDGSGNIVGQYTVSNGTAMNAFAVTGGVGIGGIEFLDVWPDGSDSATRARCFLVGAGVDSPYTTIQGYAANGSDVFISIANSNPDKRGIAKVTLP